MKNEAEKMALEWGIPFLIAALAILLRLLFTADRPTLLGLLRGVIVGFTVGALVNIYLMELPEVTDGMRGPIIGVAVLLAEDLLVALLNIGRRFRHRPIASLIMIIRGIRGK